MRKIITILIVFISSAIVLWAQGAKSFYVELGGPGLTSLNFDTRVGKKESGLGGRIGIGGFSLSTTVSNGTGTSSGHATVIFIPLGLNYLLSKDDKNYLELGAGVTPIFASASFSDQNFSSTFGHILVGYRLQPKNGGFTFRHL